MELQNHIAKQDQELEIKNQLIEGLQNQLEDAYTKCDTNAQMVLGARWWAYYWYDMKNKKMELAKHIARTYLHKLIELKDEIKTLEEENGSLQEKVKTLEAENGYNNKLFNSFIDMNLNIGGVVDPDFTMEDIEL